MALSCCVFLISAPLSRPEVLTWGDVTPLDAAASAKDQNAVNYLYDHCGYGSDVANNGALRQEYAYAPDDTPDRDIPAPSWAPQRRGAIQRRADDYYRGLANADAWKGKGGGAGKGKGGDAGKGKGGDAGKGKGKKGEQTELVTGADPWGGWNDTRPWGQGWNWY